jgi:hypothetical protein
MSKVLFITCDGREYDINDIDECGCHESPDIIFAVKYFYHMETTLLDILANNGVGRHNVNLRRVIKKINKCLESRLISYDLIQDYKLDILRYYSLALYPCESGYKVVNIDKNHFVNKDEQPVFILEYRSLKPDLYKKLKLISRDFGVEFCKNTIIGTLSEEELNRIVAAAQTLGAKLIEGRMSWK